MNATRWPSLTEFAKHLGREGLCRVEDVEGKGLHIAWIDNSPEALRRQDAIRKKERMDKGDEEREQRLIRQQIERAEMEKARDEEAEEGVKELRRLEGEKIKLSFGKAKDGGKPVLEGGEAPAKEDGFKSASPPADEPKETSTIDQASPEQHTSNSPSATSATAQPPHPEKVSLKLGSSKPKNVFSTSKKNAFSSSKPISKPAPQKPMSEAERIMKEEIERKRAREVKGFAGGLNAKRQRVS